MPDNLSAKKSWSSVMPRKGEEQEEELPEEERGDEKKRRRRRMMVVVVGFKMDADGRELLTWSLVKAADAGDRVVALYVLPSSSSATPACSLLSIVKAFDAMLVVFDGLCELKQVDLEMKVARGSSVRKVLVREAVAHGASKLVLGVSKGNHHSVVYSSTSVAKYCAKKLPQDCSVFAVSNGKILLQREAPCSSSPLLIPNLIKNASDARSFKSTVDEEPEEAREIKIPEELQRLREKHSPACRLFSYKEVIQMTSNFSPENLIGKGGSSHVYKNCLPDGHELALKVLKPSENVMEEFIAEVEISAALHHKNVVSLVGFCCENDKLTLLYNFLPRGSLEDNLHGWISNKRALCWAERFKIAVGVAEALDYLHGSGNSPAQSVIHRDVKSSNILLSEDLDPQLADFGLAMWESDSGSQLISNDVAGTFGYLAPEYFMYGKVTEKIDVYSFGVVLLELISGRKPVGSSSSSIGSAKEQKSLVMWAMPILQGGKLEELVDSCLASSYEKDQLEKMAVAASLCIKRSPRSRPPMNLVLKLLQGDEDVLRWARLQVFDQEEVGDLDDEEAALNNNIMRSHMNLALQEEADDDALSTSSVEPPTANMSTEVYLQGRWSRASSFD